MHTPKSHTQNSVSTHLDEKTQEEVIKKVGAILDAQDISYVEYILSLFIRNGISDVEELVRYKQLLFFGEFDVLAALFRELKKNSDISFSHSLYHLAMEVGATESMELLKEWEKQKIETEVKENAKEKDGTCPEFEVYTQAIFLGINKNFIVVRHKGKIIGHIKCDGEPTFLSYIFTKNKKGQPMLIPGMIYSLSGAKEAVKVWGEMESPLYSYVEFDVLITRPKRYLHTPLSKEMMDDFVATIQENTTTQLPITK